MKMRWSCSLLLHWRVDPVRLADRLPEGLELDLFGGDAFVSVVALEAFGPVPRLAVRLGLGRAMRYTQLNVRTYARSADGTRGIVLLESRVDRRLPAMGARMLGQPYHVVRPLELEVQGRRVSLRAPDLAVEGWTRDGGPGEPMPAGLESFLLDRFWVFGRLPGGKLYGVRISHAPWRTRSVEAVAQLPPDLGGIELAGDPVCAQLAQDMDVSLEEVTLLGPVPVLQTPEACVP